MKCLPLAALALLAGCTTTGPGPESDHVLIHPLFAAPYTCMEHPAGQFEALGDALGTDCLPSHLAKENGRLWSRRYTGSGERNEDWYGYGTDVLSVCDCEVADVTVSDTLNQPGFLGQPPASALVLRRADGVHIVLGHIASPVVQKGQSVKAGQKLAVVGNNGMSRNPHIHLAAWKGERPLQIRFDLVAMGKLQREWWKQQPPVEE